MRFIYDYKNDKLPSSFADNWELNNQREGYNLRNGNEFYLPRIRFNYLENHPLFAMPKIWNNLKVDFKFTMSRKTFKFSLKQYILHTLESGFIPNTCYCSLCESLVYQLMLNPN